MVEAMLFCDSKTLTREGGSVKLTPEAREGYESYFASTPWGEVELGILNPEALEQFQPGATYRVTFERVDDD